MAEATPVKKRLDLEMVERELAPSREKAQALILAGSVSIDGQKARKPGQSVTAKNRIDVAQPLRYVSRGGLKLEAALERFQVKVAGWVCLDIGTSTGGFTDCLLQHGAARVHAVDTGAGQIDWKLRTDSRVVLHEKTNARYLKPEEIGEPVDLIVCDVSFISATLILPAVAPLLRSGGAMIVLVKPQFEVGKEFVRKGGIVTDPAYHRAACERVQGTVRDLGFSSEIMDSPIQGMEGNREFLLYAIPASAVSSEELC